MAFAVMALLGACNNSPPGYLVSPPKTLAPLGNPVPMLDAETIPQAAVARQGETLAALAARIGVPVQELATYNGLRGDDVLRFGERVAIPPQYWAALPESAGFGEGVNPLGQIGVASLGAEAPGAAFPTVEALDPTRAPAPSASTNLGGAIRHPVVAGETVFSIARLYNVPVKALVSANSIGSDLSLREGQVLFIPVPAPPQGQSEPAQVTQTEPATGQTSLPGQGSKTPPPPSLRDPLPTDERVDNPASIPQQPPLQQADSAQARMAMPVRGSIIRGYEKGKNDGIDIAAPKGTAVVAAASGSVAAITTDAEKTAIIVLRHDGGLLTVYARVADINVEKGAVVARGDRIASVAGGEPSFLHFEVRKGVDSTDPTPYLP